MSSDSQSDSARAIAAPQPGELRASDSMPPVLPGSGDEPRPVDADQPTGGAATELVRLPPIAEADTDSAGAVSPPPKQVAPPVQIESATLPVAEPGLDLSTTASASTSDWRDRWIAYWDHKRTPAFLISLILHTLLFLCLAILTFVGPPGRGDNDFDFQAVISDRASNRVPIEVLAAGDRPPPPTPQQPSDPVTPSAHTATSATTLAELLQPRQPQPAQSQAQAALSQMLQASSLQINASFASTGVDGRSPTQRQKIALARGGTLASEQAVERALEWLAEHQLPSGAWSLIHDRGKCNGRCRHNGSPDRFDTAATGLSLLAFLGAGYTHRDGKYSDTVRRGIYFLLQVMEERPEGGSLLYQSERGMYNHGIATFALCEAYQLTGDEELRKAAQMAIDFTVAAQNYQGGWGYLPKQPGDLTISGWQVMGLKSAYAADLDIPISTILKLEPFLDTQQATPGIFYGYGGPGRNPTCTAIGLLIRMFRGMPHTDPRILGGAEYFQRVGRSNGDVYFNYYVSLFLFHVGGSIWENWNPKLREHLINTQSTDGHEAGSWYFDNPYGREGGRLYTTAMCAMTLEVYYRFSPLYQQTDIDFEL